jgi:hypothetical protein
MQGRRLMKLITVAAFALAVVAFCSETVSAQPETIDCKRAKPCEEEYQTCLTYHFHMYCMHGTCKGAAERCRNLRDWCKKNCKK